MQHNQPTGPKLIFFNQAGLFLLLLLILVTGVPSTPPLAPLLSYLFVLTPNRRMKFRLTTVNFNNLKYLISIFTAPFWLNWPNG